MIVFPLPKAIHKTENDIQITEELDRGQVMEVSAEISELYSKGDVVMFSEGSGVSQYYKQKNCLWLSHTDIIGIISDEKPTM
jgi:co-chaperonin GroES (HSP10)